MFLVTGCFE